MDVAEADVGKPRTAGPGYHYKPLREMHPFVSILLAFAFITCCTSIFQFKVRVHGLLLSFTIISTVKCCQFTVLVSCRVLPARGNCGLCSFW